MHEDPGYDQATLIGALTDPARYPHPADGVEHLETHISHILLAGDYAYKIKKPLDLGFLDFSSLDRREYFCREELRINRRLAPELYLDCIPICGNTENPQLGGACGRPIEWAVKMRRFPQEALLGRRLAAGAVTPRHMDDLGRLLAGFHARVARAAPDELGAEPVIRPALANFAECRRWLPGGFEAGPLGDLEGWTRSQAAALRAAFSRRQEAGFVRECHGDLHLGNIVLEGDRITVFDALEFDAALRWIDVMSDVAFLYMDLRHREEPGLAQRLLNTYLEYTGDYEGLRVLRFYLVYRAMVRAKIAAIRQGQPGIEPAERASDLEASRAYLSLAGALARPAPPFVLITHGVSGCGKTHLCRHLAGHLAAIHLRSDVERKRLFGLAPLERSDSEPGGGLYTTEASHRTYRRLEELAAAVLATGHPVMVDATFLHAPLRQRFRSLARRADVPFLLVAPRADAATLRRRIVQRHQEGGDAAEADERVLARQLEDHHPPGPAEAALEFADGDPEALLAAIRRRLGGGSGPLGYS